MRPAGGRLGDGSAGWHTAEEVTWPHQYCPPELHRMVRTLFPSMKGRRLPQVLGQRKRVSAFAVLEAAGAQDLLGEVLALAEDGRRQWEALGRVETS